MRGRALVVFLLLGCGPRDIVVVELPPIGDGGPAGMRCTSNNECHPSEFCELASCGASTGACRRRPFGCTLELNPVCGCNQVNYWNDCLRSAAGVAASVAGECSTPATCGSATACPDPAASCAQLLPSSSSCSVMPLGACWVVPRTCPSPSPGEESWEACSGPRVCGGLCDAILSEQVRRRVNSCL